MFPLAVAGFQTIPSLNENLVINLKPLLRNFKGGTIMAYYIIPAIIRKSIAVVAPVQQCRLQRQEFEACEDSSAETETDMPETPPPEYSLGGESRETSNEEIQGSCRRLLANTGIGSNAPAPPTAVKDGSINWRYANQGVSLMNHAYHESSDSRDTSDLLTRQLYLHGIEYLLQGLPRDLKDEEILSLRSVMPDVLATNECTALLVPGQRDGEAAIGFHSPPQEPTSTLQRITAGIVLHMFILAQLLLPYIRFLLEYVYRWECEHKTGQRLVSSGIRAANGLGRKTLQVSQSVRQMNNGNVGKAIDDAALWWMQGLIGGIQQGISDGVKLIVMDEGAVVSTAKME